MIEPIRFVALSRREALEYVKANVDTLAMVMGIADHPDVAADYLAAMRGLTLDDPSVTKVLTLYSALALLMQVQHNPDLQPALELLEKTVTAAGWLHAGTTPLRKPKGPPP